MSTNRETEPSQPLLVRLYVLATIGGLSALFLTLWQHGLAFWAIIPVLAGALGLALRWRGGVAVVLILLGFILLGQGYRHQGGFLAPPLFPSRALERSRAPFALTDLLLAASFLTYAAAQSRLLALTIGIFPTDPRIVAAARARRLVRMRHPRAKPLSPLETLPLPAQRRTARGPEGRELIRLFVGLPIWVALAIPIWLWLRGRRPGLPVSPEWWRAFVVLWGLGFLLIAGRAVFAYLRQATMTVEEARLYLQDVLWQETRAEQRLLNRWLEWARRRARTREKS